CVILHFALPISTRRPVVSSLLPYTTLFRSLIADAGADLQRHVARLQLEQIGHQRYDEGLRDGLAVADRQRRVEIGIGLQPQRHEFVAGDLAPRPDHLGSERGPAELTRPAYRVGPAAPVLQIFRNRSASPLTRPLATSITMSPTCTPARSAGPPPASPETTTCPLTSVA